MTTARSPLHSATDVLRRRAVEIDGPLRAAVAQLPGPLYTAAGFHLGWWDAEGSRVSAAQGKMARPAFVLGAACLAGGGVTDAAVRAGVAVELVHNFSLVHDDVMDEDRTRRGRPTVWAQYGVPYAILLGTAMLALATQVLVQNDDAGTVEPCAELSSAVIALSGGQNLDMDFEQRLRVSVNDYLEMVAGKTAALFSTSCVLGAMAGGASPDQLTALRRFGRHIGLAFQLTDDILGTFGEPSVTGKPVGADLLRYKKTMPALAAMGSGSQAGDELMELYRTQSITKDRLSHAVELVALAGGRECTEAEAARQYHLAVRWLDEAGGHAGAAAELRALANLMINRTR